MSKLLYVFVALLACLAYAHKVPTGEGIEILTSSNISLASTGDWLLILYAPWCPHCVSLLDNVPEIAEGFKKKGSHVTIGIINADAEPSIQMQFSMHGFPTLFVAHDGDVYEHPLSIGRAPDTLVEFATKGYTKYTPISGYKAPFGIVMRAFSLYSAFAIKAYRFLEVYADKLQIPPMWFFCGVAVLVAVFVIVFMILCTRCSQPSKKPAAPRKNAAKKNDSAVAASIVQHERAENPIEGAAIADTERVQEKVKEAEEEQKLRRRSVKEDKKALRDQQKDAKKKEMRNSKNPPRPQQNRNTQQPKKGH